MGANAAGNAPYSTHLQSRLPMPWPRGNQTGDPNQSPTMMVSRMTQQTSTDDDIIYWMGDPDDPEDVGATFNPPMTPASQLTGYNRKSNHWNAPAHLEEDEEYLSNMDTLQELFGFGKKPMKTYQKLVVGRPDYQNLAREAPKTALVHKKIKEKIMHQGEMTPRRAAMIEKSEDLALDSLSKLKGRTETNVEFLRVNSDDLQDDPNFSAVIAFYQDLSNKVSQALYSIQQASKLGAVSESLAEGILEDLLFEIEEEEAIDEFSAIGGGAIAGHTGPLGSDNRSPHLKKKKKKDKQYEPSMRAFGGASEVS